ncbi:hypothetical protein, partial [Cetobacterium sp.]|uniref:hypothetical protein n=1 Tax=Cetobacterium sp. TaxID=2071632 RepID=UPI003EE79D69
GRLKVRLLSVGYNEKINEFNDVIVEKELAGAFKNYFKVGSTAKLSIAFNRYVEVKEVQASMQSFGTTFTNASTTKNYINEKIIIGGEPVMIGAYTVEQIRTMKQLRELSKQEKLSAPPTPNSGDGLASGFSNPSDNTKIPKDSDLPF